MLLKLIDCRVEATRRAAFARAQCAWDALAGLDGFVFQTGGWCESDALRALVLGGWRDEAAYRAFMARAHDSIVRRSGQAGTWRSCETALYAVTPARPGDGPQPAAGVAALLEARRFSVWCAPAGGPPSEPKRDVLRGDRCTPREGAIAPSGGATVRSAGATVHSARAPEPGAGARLPNEAAPVPGAGTPVPDAKAAAPPTGRAETARAAGASSPCAGGRETLHVRLPRAGDPAEGLAVLVEPAWLVRAR